MKNVCSNCGKRLPKNTNHCNYCGCVTSGNVSFAQSKNPTVKINKKSNVSPKTNNTVSGNAYAIYALIFAILGLFFSPIFSVLSLFLACRATKFSTQKNGVVIVSKIISIFSIILTIVLIIIFAYLIIFIPTM